MSIFSSHGISIPTLSPQKQTHDGDHPEHVIALSDLHDRMERGSDSSEGGGVNNLLDDGDDDGRRLI